MAGKNPSPDRTAGMAHESDLPTDRVFLRDYVSEVEIGAYPEERGVRQRLRFNIVVEVMRKPGPAEDKVGSVINYDGLIEAIDKVAAGPRVNLIETFAERLAALCLADPRALKVHLRLEKLDRLAHGATLGCEISRRRGPESNETLWSEQDGLS
jgi:dihydroneopterin aldolase